MKTVRGRIATGKGRAADNFRDVLPLIAKRAGLPPLCEGTLNIQLDHHEPITAVTAVITNDEYQHKQECIKLRRCRVSRSDTPSVELCAVIIRPSQHEDPHRVKHWKRMELMSNHCLRTALELSDKDIVIVTYESENEVNEEWWTAACGRRN